jgi:hypothetical protein
VTTTKKKDWQLWPLKIFFKLHHVGLERRISVQERLTAAMSHGSWTLDDWKLQFAFKFDKTTPTLDRFLWRQGGDVFEGRNLKVYIETDAVCKLMFIIIIGAHICSSNISGTARSKSELNQTESRYHIPSVYAR